MEKYSGIHDDHRYENKLTRVWTFCIIAHCNWSLFWTIFSFFLLKYLNIRTKIFKYLNGSRFKYSDNSIFWYCTLKKFMLFSKLDKLTTQFDFDNALLSKKEHQWFWGIIFQLADDIYMTFSLNVCWLLKANVCFVLLVIGFFLGPLLFWLVFTFIPMISIHSIYLLNNMLHSNFEHPSSWNLKFSKNFSFSSQASGSLVARGDL